MLKTLTIDDVHSCHASFVQMHTPPYLICNQKGHGNRESSKHSNARSKLVQMVHHRRRQSSVQKHTALTPYVQGLLCQV